VGAVTIGELLPKSPWGDIGVPDITDARQLCQTAGVFFILVGGSFLAHDLYKYLRNGHSP
jgi:hypothetical protein